MTLKHYICNICLSPNLLIADDIIRTFPFIFLSFPDISELLSLKSKICPYSKHNSEKERKREREGESVSQSKCVSFSFAFHKFTSMA